MIYLQNKLNYFSYFFIFINKKQWLIFIQLHEKYTYLRNIKLLIKIFLLMI